MYIWVREGYVIIWWGSGFFFWGGGGGGEKYAAPTKYFEAPQWLKNLINELADLTVCC